MALAQLRLWSIGGQRRSGARCERSGPGLVPQQYRPRIGRLRTGAGNVKMPDSSDFYSAGAGWNGASVRSVELRVRTNAAPKRAATRGKLRSISRMM